MNTKILAILALAITATALLAVVFVDSNTFQRRTTQHKQFRGAQNGGFDAEAYLQMLWFQQLQKQNQASAGGVDNSNSGSSGNQDNQANTGVVDNSNSGSSGNQDNQANTGGQSNTGNQDGQQTEQTGLIDSYYGRLLPQYNQMNKCQKVSFREQLEIPQWAQQQLTGWDINKQQKLAQEQCSNLCTKQSCQCDAEAMIAFRESMGEQPAAFWWLQQQQGQQQGQGFNFQQAQQQSPAAQQCKLSNQICEARCKIPQGFFNFGNFGGGL